jgi:glycosyltransferase involved in cell wall biosynthesis
MKVLIVSNFYHPHVVGGAEKVAQSLAEGLLAHNHEAVVVTLSQNKHLTTDEVHGVKVHRLPLMNLYRLPAHNGQPAVVKALWHTLDTYNPLMETSFRHVLESERPEVVNTHNIAGFSASIWGAAKKRHLPLVHTAHDYYLLCPPSTMLRNGKNCQAPCSDCAMFGWGRRKASRLVDVATADSRYTLEEHLRRGYFSSAESTPIYNCCEVPALDSSRSNGGNGSLRFGFLGRLDPAKGVDLLVRSFLELPRGQAEICFAGRGAPDYESELKTMTQDRPEVRWLGYVSPDVLLRQVDVLIVPSLWNDSAPVVVLESMAYSVPLIGSRRGGIPELMGEGTGWLFEPYEPNGLTQVMRNAIESRDDLAGMRERARQRAGMFSTEAMVAGYLQAFSRAMEKMEHESRLA